MIISLYFFNFSKDFDNGDGRKCYFIRGWTYISEVSMNINCIDKREMMGKYEIFRQKPPSVPILTNSLWTEPRQLSHVVYFVTRVLSTAGIYVNVNAKSVVLVYSRKKDGKFWTWLVYKQIKYPFSLSVEREKKKASCSPPKKIYINSCSLLLYSWR